VIVFLLASYTACPPGFDLGAGAREGIPFFLLGQFSRLMIMTMVFSAPIILICLLSDVSLGIVNRFAPQLNVFFLSMPIKSALGLFMILLYLGELMPLVARELFSIGMHMDAFWGAARAGEGSL
jgi:type III secretion protein T